MKKIWIMMTRILLFTMSSFASSLIDLQDVAVNNRKIIDKYKQNIEMAEDDILIVKSGYFPSIDAAYVLNFLNEKTPPGESKKIVP